MTDLRIAYVPLVDAAVLIAAVERGFARRHGFSVTLEREPSWATLRDKLLLGHVDAAHVLAPLAVATSLGLRPGSALPLTVPFVLNLNGNAVTVSMALWRAMGEPTASAAECRAAFGRVGRDRAAAGRPLVLATVFPYSTHTYLLRRYLSACGLDPERDVAMTVVPPPATAEALVAGAVDGVCVGAPWNSVAVAAGAGRIVALGSDLAADAPEKVLAVPRRRLPDSALRDLVAALKEAADWCADAANQPDLAALLAKPQHLGLDSGLVLRSLQGRLLLQRGGPEASDPAYLRLGGAVHRPDPALADWILAEMEAAGQVRPDDRMRTEARAIFDPSCFDCI